MASLGRPPLSRVSRKAAKKGFEFNMMIIGESGVGKSTLIQSLFECQDVFKDREIPDVNELLNIETKIRVRSFDVIEYGEKLHLTIITTLGYGDALNSSNSFDPIVRYIEDQFHNYLQFEQGINRQTVEDKRVHCAVYMIKPGYGLRPLDVQMLKLLSGKVNIVPIIAKADTMSPTELKTLKKKVVEDLKSNKIAVFTIDCDSDEDPEYRAAVNSWKSAWPFAVVVSKDFVEVGGVKVRGRENPWGVIETNKPEHSDFSFFRQFLIGNMIDMKDITHQVHYENYRTEQLMKSVRASSIPAAGHSLRSNGSETTIDSGQDTSYNITYDESTFEETLRAKDEELERLKRELDRIRMDPLSSQINSTMNSQSISSSSLPPPPTLAFSHHNNNYIPGTRDDENSME